jgi:hypothetical protein
MALVAHTTIFLAIQHPVNDSVRLVVVRNRTGDGGLVFDQLDCDSQDLAGVPGGHGRLLVDDC